VQGAESLMCIDLQDFFVPVTDAIKTSFVLPAASTLNCDLNQYFVNSGLGLTSGSKFSAFFFSYPLGTATSSQQYVEWVFAREFSGPLASLDPTLIDDSGSTAGSTSSDTSYLLNKGTGIISVDGTKFGLRSTDAYAISTRGGLKFWSEIDGEIILNTFNSKIPSNDVTCVSYSPSGTLYVGTGDAGIFVLTWSNSGGFSFSITDSTSGLVSDIVNDIYFSNNLLAVATSAGISLYDYVNKTWSSFSRTNVNEINSISFSSVFLDSGFLLAGSLDGVYVYDISGGTWKLYSSATTGWTVSNAVNRLISVSQTAYVATSTGIVSFVIGATTCAVIDLPVTLADTNISDIAYVAGASSNSLIVSSISGALSEYDFLGLTGATWTFSVTGSNDSLSLGTKRIDANGYVYFVNDFGFSRFDTTLLSTTLLPLSTQTSDILFSYPSNGACPVSLSQSIYIAFSKQVDQTVLQNHIEFTDTTTGATVSYSLTSTNGYYYTVIPSSDLSYGNSYEFQVVQGLTSIDGKYFRQTIDSSFITYDKNPINGWNPAGKQLTLSGADGRLCDSIVFRNPQNFNVDVTALIAS